MDFVGKVMSLLFTMWASLVIVSSKEQASFNFKTVVTICSDVGAPKNKVCHCFHCFPIYLPWSDGTRCQDLSFLNVDLITMIKFILEIKSISPSNEYSGLISFTIDWFDLLTVQGTLKSLLQHHSSKASILQCSAFFIVQHSHPYMTTGKRIALTRQTFLGKSIVSTF